MVTQAGCFSLLRERYYHAKIAEVKIQKFTLQSGETGKVIILSHMGQDSLHLHLKSIMPKGSRYTHAMYSLFLREQHRLVIQRSPVSHSKKKNPAPFGVDIKLPRTQLFKEPTKLAKLKETYMKMMLRGNHIRLPSRGQPARYHSVKCLNKKKVQYAMKCRGSKSHL